MNLGRLKRKQPEAPAGAVVQLRPGNYPFHILDRYVPLMTPETKLYACMREAIPVIDSALYKIQRLIGGFRFVCSQKSAERELNQFAREVKVGPTQMGMESFVCSYLDSLLLFGNAIGEIVLSANGRQIAGLYNSSFEDVLIQRGDNPLQVGIFRNDHGNPVPLEMPQLILFTALNPQPGKVCGDSILKSLPFVSSILLKIYHAIGENFDRVGNVRFAVTYRPSNQGMDAAYAKERAQQIAKEWAAGMAAGKTGDIRDFIAVGDVDIKVIGADNQMIDCEVPARQMLEQIIAKLGLPPFMLDLSWSTTERMSQQQASTLNSELCYYRRLLNPVLERIATTYLRLNGFSCQPTVEWDTLNFEDEINAAQARLYKAQAAKLELENGEEPKQIPVDLSTAIEP